MRDGFASLINTRAGLSHGASAGHGRCGHCGSVCHTSSTDRGGRGVKSATIHFAIVSGKDRSGIG